MCRGLDLRPARQEKPRQAGPRSGLRLRASCRPSFTGMWNRRSSRAGLAGNHQSATLEAAWNEPLSARSHYVFAAELLVVLSADWSIVDADKAEVSPALCPTRGVSLTPLSSTTAILPLMNPVVQNRTPGSTTLFYHIIEGPARGSLQGCDQISWNWRSETGLPPQWVYRNLELRDLVLSVRLPLAMIRRRLCVTRRLGLKRSHFLLSHLDRRRCGVRPVPVSQCIYVRSPFKG